MPEVLQDGSLVTVPAQVMIRDDSSGGWIPLSGCGLANVSVRRRSISSEHQTNSTNGTGIPSSSVVSSNTNSTQSGSNTAANAPTHGSCSNSPSDDNQKFEYFIHGKRTSDQSVVLSCTIKRDFEYNKVMPTFHHWRVGEKKFGLTFKTAADGRAFDEGVRLALKELLEGLTNVALRGNVIGTGEEDIFMTLNLPVERSEPRRMSNFHTQCPDPPDPQKPIHFIDGPSVKMPPSTPQHPLEPPVGDGSDSYVHLTKFNHEYLYPTITDHKTEPRDTRNSGNSIKKAPIANQPSKNAMKRIQLRCKYCQEVFTQENNPRGSCEYAPDPIKRSISNVSCLSCAQCMLYHCTSDSEGDFVQHPCSCEMEEGCGRRWFGLALLSMIVPCLWIYPPLRALHWCGMTCGVCGGRHRPME